METLQFLATLGVTAANVAIVLLFLNYLKHRDTALAEVLEGVRDELKQLNDSHTPH